MKIGFLINSLEGGGAERVVVTLANHMAIKNHEVHIFLINNIIEYQLDSNIHLHILGNSNSNKFLKLIFSYLKFKKLYLKIQMSQEFNFFTSHLPLSNYVGILANIPNHYIVIHSTYSKLFKNKFRLWLNIKLLNSKNIITVSQGMLDDLYDNRLKTKTSKVIYNPFDIENIKVKSLESNIQIPQTKYIISVGRLCKEKRFDYLIEAFSKLSDKEVKLVIVGKGELEDRLKRLVKELHLTHRVLFAGWQSNPYNWIKNARVYVLTSEYEGLPTALVESLVCKTPVVSVNCPSGPSEILVDELNEFLVPINDIDTLVNIIDKALLSYPCISEKYINKFKVENIVYEYLSLGK